jgi:hypothetical protein
MDDKLFVCTQCHNVIGEIRTLSDDLKVLYICDNPIRSYSANCGRCGAGIDWSIGEETLRKLIKHVLNLREIS